MADKNKDTIKDIIDQTFEKVEPQLKKAKEKAKPYIDKAQPTINKAKEAVEPSIKKAKEAVEPSIKKAKEKTEPVVKEAVSKVAKATTKTEVFLQFGDHERRIDDVIEKVREDYLSGDKNVRDLKKLRIYIKPEDQAAYYVANQNETGKVSL